MGGVDLPAISNGGDREPLISSPQTHSLDHLEKKSVFLVWLKWVLEVLIIIVSVSWVTVVFLYSVKSLNTAYKIWTTSAGTIDGTIERVFLVFSSPFLVVAFLAMVRQVVVDSLGEDLTLQLQKTDSAKPSYKLHTFPVMVDGLLGVVSAAELIGIIIVIVYLSWTLILYTITNFQELAVAEAENKMYILFRAYGIGFGDIGSFATSFLFMPVARGSIFLRAINVSFDHATKYHIWLGNLTMAFYTLHGISMAISYTSKGEFTTIFSWATDDEANLAGLITLVIGLLMWITSIRVIRRKYFETFYYTHQLYILFVLFFALHAGGIFFAAPLGSIFIYIFDSFLRFFQSRKAVDVVSSKYLSCGVVELTLAKPPNLRYNALSFIFLRIGEVSRLQWHPFSVSSTPLDGKNHITVMIKVRGEWTSKLKRKTLSMLSKDGGPQNFRLTACVEGPYGHELPYYITYKDLVLVAGGIGISPFLAIMKDILARVREGKPCLVRNILLVWAIKKSDELSLISKLSSSFSDELINVETRVYVSRESGPPSSNYGHDNGYYYDSLIVPTTTARRAISGMVGTGNSKWVLIYFVFSVTGLVTIRVLSDIFGASSWVAALWFRGFVTLATPVAAVFLPGGLALGLWSYWEAKPEAYSGLTSDDTIDPTEGGYLFKENITSINYGARPDLEDVFESVNEAKGHVDVGVIVCGPTSLESSTAAQCRRLNWWRKGHQPIFHFHSHSFSL